jgi:hypothetical protein
MLYPEVVKMAKLLVYLDDDAHEDLKELAHRHKTTMAALVRYAIDKTFEDQLDVIAGERGLEEYLRDPSSAVSLDDLLKEMGVAVQNGNKPASGAKHPTTPAARRSEGAPSAPRATRQPVPAGKSKARRN